MVSNLSSKTHFRFSFIFSPLRRNDKKYCIYRNRDFDCVLNQLIKSFIDSFYVNRSYSEGGLGGKSKKKLKLGQTLEKKILPVETDPVKLVNFVCGSNIMKEGQDIAVKPDSEYPAWLWEIHTGPPKPLEELDPDSKLYWRRVKKAALRRNNLLAKLKRF